ncbi:MAG TPA: YidC/Oxa1 family membrane protein insertase [Solirubrobacteraceae bacterium]|jgi:YidC/Oxa1 family membrane protein insertase|nr:YidC/Oxa1 family membrane protein insertase [Solirubrobacteraceae bacterium]
MLFLANIFQPLIDVFETVLKFFHHSLGAPWGWAIVLLTVAMRLVLLPLTVRQFHSMQALQRLQPELKALQAKYKEDKQRQQQELMKFYKENNVNPLGSCLPMVLQLPVFISLYYMLRQSLRKDICPNVLNHYAAVHHVTAAVAATKTSCGNAPGASFLFISDLTNQAHGVVLIVLMVLYVGTQLASSMLMATPTMDTTQRRIMMFMPLIFVFFIFRFPAGLLVYWITTNTWTMGQQFVLRRRLVPAVAAAPAVAGAGATTTGNGRASTPVSPQPRSRPAAGAGAKAANGSAAGGGLGGLLRGRLKPEEPVTPQPQARTTAPPRSPRKKKKRSGRRR